jgi:3-oxoacyl-[acyl-carrier protein] reductase
LPGVLHGKVALVTGSSRGIGRTIVRKFASEGAKVCINYKDNRQAAEELLDELKKGGADAITVKADVSNKPEVQAMVREISKELGPVDILVNNAGISSRADVFHIDEEQLRRTFDVNVMGSVYCVSDVIQQMKERRYGKIVFISSVAGLGTALLGTTPYALTKGALIVLTKRYALELGEFGINVNGIAPGHIETEMFRRGRTDEDIEKMLQHTELRRIGKPDEIASVVLFLCSEASSFMTGQVLVVDGGRTDFVTHSV